MNFFAFQRHQESPERYPNVQIVSFVYFLKNSSMSNVLPLLINSTIGVFFGIKNIQFFSLVLFEGKIIEFSLLDLEQLLMNIILYFEIINIRFSENSHHSLTHLIRCVLRPLFLYLGYLRSV